MTPEQKHHADVLIDTMVRQRDMEARANTAAELKGYLAGISSANAVSPYRQNSSYSDDAPFASPEVIRDMFRAAPDASKPELYDADIPTNPSVGYAASASDDWQSLRISKPDERKLIANDKRKDKQRAKEEAAMHSRNKRDTEAHWANQLEQSRHRSLPAPKKDK